MTQQQRQEPTFGEPSPSSAQSSHTEQATTPKLNPNLSFSLHSKQSPGHTFTPVLKRPAELAQHFSTLEEQEMLKHTSPKTETTEQTVAPAIEAQPRQFAFTPATAETPESNTDEPNESSETVNEPTPFKAEPVLSKPKNEAAVNETAKEADEATPNPAIERIIPVQPAAQAKKSAVADKVPTKYRRLLLVLLLLLALVLVFFLLKPKTPQTVEELQQGTSLPIEFRPVDEAEAKRAEEEAKALQRQLEAEQQAKAEAEAQQQAQAQQAVQSSENSANNATNSVATNTHQPVQTESAPAPQASQPAVNNEVAKPSVQPVAPSRPVVIEPVKKPATQTSVIHQPEKPVAAKADKVEKVVKVEKTTPAPKKAEVKETKPATQEKSAAAVSSAASSKTLVVAKGVTLFQNFRDNGLAANLPELNKMTKLNGKTSELKPGQKIVVRLDAQQRIVEMNIGIGKYLRQADGSYIYK